MRHDVKIECNIEKDRVVELLDAGYSLIAFSTCFEPDDDYGCNGVISTYIFSKKVRNEF